MKKLILAITAILVAGWVGAAELNWETDFDAAVAKAKKENKLVFINFTGSDWCGWCKKLDAEVLSTPEFKEFAAKNLVLLYVDFPAKKELPAAQKKANEELKKKYGVRGFPTIVVLNGQGDKVYEKVGFMAGVDKWLAALKEAKGK
ncbi:thioredoxin family protein [Fontisphaera persica]|uniref:thioredoxin family protein n=1 Tax=Fontisphaera persica TaxID=2974023 RepID=UPI0024C0C861|nr:thioredoxin family protein [Fontisphaera persica]WCJ60559.1 thioredoxin family protein [Fontisphaera persica]